MLLIDCNPGILQVFQDLSNEHPQGGVHRLPFDLKSPVLKAFSDPDLGDIYLAGFQIFGSKAKKSAGIRRIRFTGQNPGFLPIDARSTELGILLTFSQPLDLTSASRDHFKVQRWNYLRSQKYGSGHYKLDGARPRILRLQVFRSVDSRHLLLTILR